MVGGIIKNEASHLILLWHRALQYILHISSYSFTIILQTAIGGWEEGYLVPITVKFLKVPEPLRKGFLRTLPLLGVAIGVEV